MAVGNIEFPHMHAVSGIKLGATCAGIKQTERDDLLLVEMTEATTCAAVFTQNAFCAAPVLVARDNLEKQPRYLLVNSGNANAGTGEQGLLDAQASCAAVAKLSDVNSEQVLPFSTGVIGEALPINKIVTALAGAQANLKEDNWDKAAHAILTTDTFAKGYSKIIEIDGQSVTVTGMSKGAGMIQPNMATMLGFIATDARISQANLQECLTETVEQSFNRITVDGDTSTNDACVLMASGKSSLPELIAGSDVMLQFQLAIQEACKYLAEAIIRDGEGATKLIKIKVQQAVSDAEAVEVAKTIAHSPLVKTAFFASDPNWGRILAAVGRSGVDGLDVNKISIYLGDVCIVDKGGRATSYTEAAGQKIMDQQEITVTVDLGRGECEQQVLTCDFSYDYVRINAEYRT
ncbi:glutamate N-acetyltransferase/amino-acid N-acetyltransferase [Bathymodiolus platifrons methanotrophic gill symbiont]|uniref:bifunctional glutamate N-acetyltransferase/amino-acid acetyltransferase ArgJ n=1 Tax=Bathymodiolus platifrons methanotrophic gill symbiont TaxID=113268 RepID=UPI000B41B5A3|nr:bifunctional glutamate N-acetyltransferase/amino-acid acetyltransferase ArgJ [Bathymodiolus platifrons methanotrophic gill symbiont]TXK96889.1 bifunctional ornithine acetyltransferase/N-acetylglutamate synthase [Methylococcaceae bacterium CS4]TXL07765.1 bifunctional ornithine acetyltransferase/N-acetylglutamate synthase [Methylococcaceae bacterium CS1]TXL12224.1 bifunctional ornithine acetyltransferase/N-acetylglutamate synthase [Methylococcaceae bacterium CS2]TXL17232.1 bifunctional ornithi